MKERIKLAERKRVRRVERNLRNEARQGNAPDGLDLMKDGTWRAQCKCCKRSYEIFCEAHEFLPDMSYCGRSEWCTP